MDTIEKVLSGATGSAGIQRLLSGGAARQVLRRKLTGMLGKDVALGPCRLRRAKFKPGRRLTGWYDVTIVGGTGRRSIRPIAVTWYSPGNSKVGESEPAWRSQEAEASALGIARPFDVLVESSGRPAMDVLVSPVDARFPMIVRLSDPRYVRDMVERLSPKGEAAPEAASPTYTVTPIRYRPGERHVLRYDVQAGPDAATRTPCLFAKLYTDPAAGARHARVLVAASEHLAAHCPGMRPVDGIHSPVDSAIIQLAVHGVALTHHLVGKQRRVAGLLCEAGAGLRALHSGPASLSEGLPVRRLADELHAVERAAEHLPALLPDTHHVLRDIIEDIGDSYQHCAADQLSFVHNDFKADHLILTRQGMVLLDFDSCCVSDPALDIGKFLADLRWWYLRSADTSGLQDARSAFLAGYGALPAPVRTASRLCEALIFAKLTLRRVRLYYPDWAAQTAALIGVAGRIMRDEAALPG